MSAEAEEENEEIERYGAGELKIITTVLAFNIKTTKVSICTKGFSTYNLSSYRKPV